MWDWGPSSPGNGTGKPRVPEAIPHRLGGGGGQERAVRVGGMVAPARTSKSSTHLLDLGLGGGGSSQNPETSICTRFGVVGTVLVTRRPGVARERSEPGRERALVLVLGLGDGGGGQRKVGTPKTSLHYSFSGLGEGLGAARERVLANKRSEPRK